MVEACSSAPTGGDKSIAKAVACIQPVSAPVSHPTSGPSSSGDEQSSFDFLCSLTSSGGKYAVGLVLVSHTPLLFLFLP